MLRLMSELPLLIVLLWAWGLKIPFWSQFWQTMLSGSLRYQQANPYSRLSGQKQLLSPWSLPCHHPDRSSSLGCSTRCFLTATRKVTNEFHLCHSILLPYDLTVLTFLVLTVLFHQCVPFMVTCSVMLSQTVKHLTLFQFKLHQVSREGIPNRLTDHILSRRGQQCPTSTQDNIHWENGWKHPDSSGQGTYTLASAVTRLNCSFNGAACCW